MCIHLLLSSEDCVVIVSVPMRYIGVEVVAEWVNVMVEVARREVVEGSDSEAVVNLIIVSGGQLEALS